MPIHQDPRSIIDADTLTHEQRMEPGNMAAIALHAFAVALSDAGFEVHADTWRLYFHEPSDTGILSRLIGQKRRQFEIRAHADGSFSIEGVTPKTGAAGVAGGMKTIHTFITTQFPKRIIASPASIMTNDVKRRLHDKLQSLEAAGDQSAQPHH